MDATSLLYLTLALMWWLLFTSVALMLPMSLLLAMWLAGVHSMLVLRLFRLAQDALQPRLRPLLQVLVKISLAAG